MRTGMLILVCHLSGSATEVVEIGSDKTFGDLVAALKKVPQGRAIYSNVMRDASDVLGDVIDREVDMTVLIASADTPPETLALVDMVTASGKTHVAPTASVDEPPVDQTVHVPETVDAADPVPEPMAIEAALVETAVEEPNYVPQWVRDFKPESDLEKGAYALLTGTAVDDNIIVTPCGTQIMIRFVCWTSKRFIFTSDPAIIMPNRYETSTEFWAPKEGCAIRNAARTVHVACNATHISVVMYDTWRRIKSAHAYGRTFKYECIEPIRGVVHALLTHVDYEGYGYAVTWSGAATATLALPSGMAYDLERTARPIILATRALSEIDSLCDNGKFRDHACSTHIITCNNQFLTASDRNPISKWATQTFKYIEAGTMPPTLDEVPSEAPVAALAEAPPVPPIAAPVEAPPVSPVAAPVKAPVMSSITVTHDGLKMVFAVNAMGMAMFPNVTETDLEVAMFPTVTGTNLEVSTTATGSVVDLAFALLERIDMCYLISDAALPAGYTERVPMDFLVKFHEHVWLKRNKSDFVARVGDKVITAPKSEISQLLEDVRVAALHDRQFKSMLLALAMKITDPTTVVELDNFVTRFPCAMEHHDLGVVYALLNGVVTTSAVVSVHSVTMDAWMDHISRQCHRHPEEPTDYLAVHDIVAGLPREFVLGVLGGHWISHLSVHKGPRSRITQPPKAAIRGYFALAYRCC